MNARQRAEARYNLAKLALNRAALASFRGWPLSEQMAASALAAIEEARRELRALGVVDSEAPR